MLRIFTGLTIYRKYLMLQTLKRYIKDCLRYEPLIETKNTRKAIEAVSVDGLPYCPSYEGDLLFSLILANGFQKCLEVGFHTGSTALYLTEAVAGHGGLVTSICLDDDESVERGLRLLRTAGLVEHHRLIRKNSNRAVPELFLSGERFDFIFMDGWKTFDHLAFEMYFTNQMLECGGVIAFDDSHMPSVRKAIHLLKQYYGYEEVDYTAYNQNLRLRIFHWLTSRSPYRPYRAFMKTLETKNQLPFQDWNFYRPV